MSEVKLLRIALFGALRQFESRAEIFLECPLEATVLQLRARINAYASAHWPASALPLLEVSAIASELAVLRDDQIVPREHALALLPPVSGG